MADGTCDLGETPHARNWILTRLNPVLTVELCDEDFVPGIIGLLAAELGVEYGIVYGQLERMLARELKKADRDLADAQAAEAAEGSQDPASDLNQYEQFPDLDRDLRAERKHGDGEPDEVSA